MPARDYKSDVWKAAVPTGRRGFRVLVVEDDESVRSAFRDLLRTAEYEVVEARNVADAKDVLRGTLDLHAALVDYSLPDGPATEIVKELLDRKPLCRAVVVTGTSGSEVASESARAGAHAYLRKPQSGAKVLDAVSRTVQSTLDWRRALTSSSPDGVVRFDVSAAVARLRYLGQLSPAETITTWRLLWGDSNKRIAELLGCSERTVKFHVADVLARTGARTRAGLLRVLLEDAGIRDPWESKN